MDRPTILVVDDDPLVTQMLGILLDLSFNVNIVTTNSALEARAILQEKKVALLLTDYLMPELNGINLIRALRDQGGTIPVIILTGYCDEPEVEANAKVLGPFEVIVKPWDNEYLLKRIKTCLEKASASQDVDSTL